MQILNIQNDEVNRLSPKTQRTIHIIRDSRGGVQGGLIEYPNLHVNAGSYPDPILELAALLQDDTERSPFLFYDLWEMLLSFWFPEDQGFAVEKEWQIPFSSGAPEDDEAFVTYAVMHTGRPIVLVQVNAPADWYNEHTRAMAEALARSHFDQVAPYCELPELYVISAMGKKWSAFCRSVYLTSGEAECLPEGDDRFEWMEDAVSEVSYEVLERYAMSMKAYTLALPSS